MKKTFAVILAVMMLVCVLSACGTKDATESTTPDATVTDDSTTEPTDDATVTDDAATEPTDDATTEPTEPAA